MGNLSSFGGGIKSIQTGTIDITLTNASNTATITSVDTAKAFIIPQGVQCTLGTPDLFNTHALLALTNATTVTATRVANASSTTRVGFTVVEFY